MVEMTIEDAQKTIANRDKMTELLNSRNFKSLFVNGYFKDEAARLAQAITNPEMQDEIDQREIEGQIRAIGHVQNYILTIKQKGDAVERALIEKEQDELEAERRANMEIVVDPITGEEIEVKDD